MNKITKLIILSCGVALASMIVWGAITISQLNATRHELSVTKAELVNTQEKLAQTEAQLADTVSVLDTTKVQLTSTKTELANTTASLLDTRNELADVNDQLVTAEETAATLMDTLLQTQERLAISQSTLNGLGITISASSACIDVVLVDNPAAVDPTFNQLMTFLAQDTTENHAYILNVYDCSQFSRDLHNRAEAAGIRCAEVQIRFSNTFSRHALNAFLTTDYGLVYVDCTETPDRFARVKVTTTIRELNIQNVPPQYVRVDSWWDTLHGFYYIQTETGTQAIVSSIRIYW